jgi:hypothetical protein
VPDPINQIQEFAAHTVATYGSVGEGSYVTGHAAAQDAKAILAVIDCMIFLEIYQCDECGRYQGVLDLCHYCGGEPTKVQAISKRKKKR